MENRKIEILNTIINSYIDSPTPIGSRTISKVLDSKVSSATIRNEMADLEEMGYLNKPHTSAGRIPSNKAYRFFVDELQTTFMNHSFVDDSVKKLLTNNILSLSDIFRNSVRELANISALTSYLVVFKKPDTKIKFIELINLNRYSILLLIVGNKGVVEKQIINSDIPINDMELKAIVEMLNTYLSGIDFSKVGSVKLVLKGNITKYESFIKDVIRRTSTFNETVSSVDVYYDGVKNILNFQEFFSMDKVRNFIELIEDRDFMLNRVNLDFNSNNDIDVIIGSDEDLDILKETSFVRSKFNASGNFLGQIGVIGPVRMDYKRQMKLVKVFKDSLVQAVDEVVR